MTWSDFYLICFAVGFCFSFFSFVFGGSRFGKLHLPHFHGHAHFPTAHGPVGHGPAVNGQAAQAGGNSAAHVHHAATVSPFNPPSIAAFLAWFGGAGYLLTRFSAIWVGTALWLSILAGLMGGAIIFFFLTKVLISDQEYLDPADFEMVGVLGKLSVSIREGGGTGELIYSQMGTRHVCGARSDDGSAMAKGSEVVVTRYDRGIAYVRLWSEMSGEVEEASPNKKAVD
jgi:hypothetical protein